LIENETLITNFETKTRDEHTINEEMYKKAKQDTELYYWEKTQGSILRSKCQIYEEGEKSTKFFLGLEKKRAINGTIDMLKVDDNTEVNDYNDVLSEIKKFYKNLFSKKDLDNSGTSVFLEGLGLPKISESDKNRCDQDVTREDMKAALKSMRDNKSPGNDGISREFYVFFGMI